jgi:hypothetical protein
MHKKKFLFLLKALLTITGISPVMAQKEPDSLLLFREKLMSVHWDISKNPVWINDIKLPSYTGAGLIYEFKEGNFRRPQEAKKEQFTGFGAEGFSTFKNWKFYGGFKYVKLQRDSIRFANVARPYDGNPFITADSLSGNWKGDQLTGNLQVGFPEFGKWKTGLGMAYETEQSARMNEPKPLNRFLNFQIQPALAYSFNSSNSLSITMAYTKRNETVETGFFSDNNPPLYSIRGYGTFSKGPVVTAERNTTGSGLEAGLDYKYNKENSIIFAGFRIAQRTEDINDGVSRPIFIGGFDETRAEAFLSYEMKSKNRGWIMFAKGWMRDGTGYDPIFKAINPAYFLSGINSRIGWWKQINKKKWINLNARPGISYSNYFESVAKTEWTSIILHQDVSTAFEYQMTDKLKLFAEPQIGYHFNLQKSLIINRPSILSELLVRPDFSINSTNYLKSTLRASGEYKSTGYSYRLQLSYNYLNATGKYMNGNQIGINNYFQTSFNVLF